MRHGVLVGSNERSKLLYAAMETVIRASLGDEVTVFLTMDAVRAFTRNPVVTESTTSSRLAKEAGEDYLSHLRKAKTSGRAEVLACSYASKLFHLSKEDYIDVVDDVAGITTFVSQVDGQIVSVW
ncbi:hypothetical protein HS1genome_2149 [Sulfodiicoccus acidiphilus]|uniref:Uncharacterized protein n=1 Tax=Sulfodiicoccus acidiphilus TaxID=1670455 RepID=A0A348B6F8_9CREN|nr:DsrE family protein [Sulfodiicoccus acidiphilus]BBD73760.1 hypothetical protein HS1genome_2149 [Sulfodiicoccus acidiphilus]GGT98142.1 hypothetical protein GCM10007116_14650 [Sulfodiicoccus acidiphilus]